MFLTPTKPRKKVVMASDVQSCLYYVHVDSAEDEKLSEALLSRQYQFNGDNAVETDKSPHGPNAVQRNTLRHEPNLRFDRCPELSLPSHPQSISKRGIQVERKPVVQTLSPTVTSVTDTSAGLSAPGLLGPRPMHQRPRSTGNSAPHSRPERTNIDTRWMSDYLSEKSPDLPPRPRRGQDQETAHPPRGHSAHTQERSDVGTQVFPYHNGDGPPAQTSKGTTKTHQSHPGEDTSSLTLIRRYADVQWNVGRILRSSGRTPSDNAINTEYGPPLVEAQDGTLIEISTPGYAKFTGRGSPNGREEDLRVKDPRGWSSQEERRTAHIYDGDQEFFQCQIQAGSFKKKRDQKRRSESSGDSSLGWHGSSSKSKLHRRSQISESDEKVKMISAQPSAKQQTVDSKGYIFQSPWDGFCEFHMGLTGRSLKCRHTVLPLRTISKAPPRSASVSELRFNLPSSKSLGASPVNKSKAAERHTYKRSSFSQQKSYEVDGDPSTSSDSDRLDLSLGQEHAGGGFDGKQAKLGKLIVENEGLKMLDLLVAANIGIWWRVYEKTSLPFD